MEFHSPYQFIPIKKCKNKTDFESLADLENENNLHVRHDRWHKDGISGRISCTLTAQSPLVIGAKQEPGTQHKSGTVHPYLHKNKTPAIPANSLRGMVASIVEAISNSSLRVLASEKNSTYSKGNLHQALERMADKDSLPWNKNRNQLTLAECLFGVVEDEPAEDKPARNLASRIQFTDATAKKDIALDKPVILKILDSPKPPSPAMYFHSQNGGPISKKNLDLTRHNPNGRKSYLPHPKTDYKNKKIWQTKYTKDNPPSTDKGIVNWKQYLSCTPIPEKSEFRFFIHFENLSSAELGLLQTAIQPSEETETFWHRLGLGKPLGLGQITLAIDKIELIDRTQRYSLNKLNQDRYQAFTEQADTSAVDQQTLDIVKTIHNPNNITEPVCYPFNGTDRQAPYHEGEGFSWFVKNDKLKNHDRNKQKLNPISAGKKIPTLNSFKKD